MSPAPRTPVVIGVSQLSNRTDRGAPVLSPVELMAEAGRSAAADAAPRVLAAVDALRTAFSLSGADRNVPLAVAAALGIDPPHQAMAVGGGEVGGTMLGQAAEDVAAGAHDMVLLVSGEAWYSQVAARRAGRDPEWAKQRDEVAPAVVLGDLGAFVSAHEESRALADPVQWYALFEHALRRRAGRGIAEHRAFLAELWARFSDCAADNPYAWDPSPHAAAEIATPGPGNRLVCSPYTKLLCSNEQVDQAAALVVTSTERAEALGVPRDRWVFPAAAARGKAPFLSERVDLAEAPLARLLADELTALAGWAPVEADHVDLYSCFPSAVQLQADGFGLSLDRPLTVTGGMRFAGGPWCGYPVHALAALVSSLREHGGRALCCANGGAVTKLSAVALSADLPSRPFRFGDVADAMAAQPTRRVEQSPSATAAVETYAIRYARDGAPVDAVVACLLPDGSRALGVLGDTSTLTDEPDLLGVDVRLAPDGTAELV